MNRQSESVRMIGQDVTHLRAIFQPRLNVEWTIRNLLDETQEWGPLNDVMGI